MTSLKNKNVNKCFSLLREYLEGTPQDGKKGSAILALEQLQNITAGVGTPGSPAEPDSPICISKPLANGSTGSDE